MADALSPPLSGRMKPRVPRFPSNPGMIGSLRTSVALFVVLGTLIPGASGRLMQGSEILANMSANIDTSSRAVSSHVESNINNRIRNNHTMWEINLPDGSPLQFQMPWVEPSSSFLEVDTAPSPSSSSSKGDEFSPCKTCVFVVERTKKGTNMLLPSICSEVFDKFPSAYGTCHQVLNALSVNGGNLAYWLFEGCYKYEIYQAKEWVKPCPSHVVCAALKGLDKENFCDQVPMEDPFSSGGTTK
mmetsp:Transcript_24062/g.42609  ORF Transcript_24062/g.42609 Transcript_24062/m.42609 type:complete len:244 (-) Transcript_24062:100-831(-)